MNTPHDNTTSTSRHERRALSIRPRGVVLLAVLIVITMSAMVAASLLFRMRAETATSAATLSGDQAHDAAMSGIDTVIAMLTAPPLEGALPPLSDTSLWLDNPDMLKNQLVVDDGANRWYFTIYAPSSVDPDSPRFGVIDETGKVNINIAPDEVLLSLPGMTPELLDTLRDYLDNNDETRPDGAEQDYYDQLPTPYLIRNGPLTTLEELLLVKGFNASILYGEDANFNGLLEPNEDDGDESFPPDDNDGQLNRGLLGAATVDTTGPDTDAEGNQRINLNGRNSNLRDTGLSDATISFIESVRADGVQFTHPSQLLGMTHRVQRNDRRSGLTQGQTLRSPVDATDLPIVMDKLTTNPGGRRVPIFGLLNVNTASVAALAALPQIDATLAQQIAETRVTLDPQQLTSTAWLYTEGLLDEEAYKAVAPLLTPRGYQFRIRSIGFGVPSGRFRIMEVIVDFAQDPPRIVYQRDLTRLGLPFPLDAEQEELGT